MKVEQLRDVLDTLARQKRRQGREREAEALQQLSDVLRPTGKLAVTKVVEKLRS